MIVAVASWAFAAPPDAATLEQAWERHRATLDAAARYPFHLEPELWRRLAEGGVARRRDRLDGTDRVLGVVWVPATRDATWVAVQDPHGEAIDGFVDEELPGSTFDERLVYQRIDLPWPLVSRQWVIRVRNNAALWAQSQGAVWERSWDLSEAREGAPSLPNGVWLPANEGGWFVVEAGAGTLLGYHVRTAIGGIVPDEAALRWSFSTLEGLLVNLRDRAGWAVGHYVDGHGAVRRPDGSEIPRFQATTSPP